MVLSFFPDVDPREYQEEFEEQSQRFLDAKKMFEQRQLAKRVEEERKEGRTPFVMLCIALLLSSFSVSIHGGFTIFSPLSQQYSSSI